MTPLDVAYHMRDHTPRWLRWLNLSSFVAFVLPAVFLRWWPGYFACVGVAALNWVIGYRSFKQRQRDDLRP